MKQSIVSANLANKQSCVGQNIDLVDLECQISYQESSPSFCTDQHHEQAMYVGDSFTLTSQQSSVSQFDHSSYQISTTQMFENFNVHHSVTKSIRNKQNPTKTFLPDINSLTQHIDILESEIFLITKEYLKIKTFCSAVISSVKTLLSEQVGTALQKYMKQHFIFAEFQDFANFTQENSINDFQSNFSKQLLTKLNSQSLQYSLDMNSKQMSMNVQEIFTLGSSKFIFDNHTSSEIDKKDMNCKSTQKKPKNFNKNKLDKNKQNILTQAKSTNEKSHLKPKHNQSSRYSEKSMNNMNRIKNESMKFLTNDYASTSKSSNTSTPRNSTNNYSTPTIATQLLCEVCKVSFQPNEFFKHLSNCSNQQQNSISSLRSTQKLALNYTIMMQKLFDMRQQIESQIQLMQVSRKKSHEKVGRQRLKKKLEEDLQKVTKIIQEKQKQMQIHLSKNILKDTKEFRECLQSHLKFNKYK